MRIFNNKSKKEALKGILEIKDAIYKHVQPFNQMPSVNNVGSDISDRINAHDLFSFYTADIIKEDVIFAR